MTRIVLSVGGFGDRVAMLQRDLMERGFAVPLSEQERRFFGPGTRSALCEFQKALNAPISGVLDSATAAALAAPQADGEAPPQIPASRLEVSEGVAPPSVETSAYEVHGTVMGHEGASLPGARITVWRQSIRERQELASGETSQQGQYSLRFGIPKAAPEPVLIVIEAAAERLEHPLFSPPTQVQKTLEINLSLELTDQSEWAKLVRSIEPLLDGLTLEELVENRAHQDISFLARALGKGVEVVMLAAASARLGRAFKIEAPVFYAFLRQQEPAKLPNPLLESKNFALIDAPVRRIGPLIFNLSKQVQTQTLVAAVALNLIGPQFTEKIPQIVSELQALHAADLLNQAQRRTQTQRGRPAPPRYSPAWQLLRGSGVLERRPPIFLMATKSTAWSSGS